MSVSAFFKGKDLALISIACIPGGGKTTFRELFTTLLTYVQGMRDRVHSVDMSDLLDQNASGRSQGAMVTNDVVTSTITGHFTQVLGEKPRTDTIVWSGWPRDKEQAMESRSFARRGILYLDTPMEIAYERYINRWLKTPPGKRRPDDPQTIDEAKMMFRKRKTVFENTVLPMLDEHRDCVVVVDRTAPLLIQLCGAVHGLSYLKTPAIHQIAAGRIVCAVQSDRHPIHDMISNIEHPQPVGKTETPEESIRSVRNDDRFFPLNIADPATA